ILKALNNEKIPLYGSGQNVREWLFVSVCVDGIFRILEKGKVGETYNVGSGEEKRNIEVVKAILKLLGKPEDLIEFTKDRAGHDFRYSLNSDKVREQTGWNGEMPFSEGIKDTVKWYIDNRAWVDSKLGYLNKYWQTVYLPV
ncbi:MAG: GDP-mannose 4,6-dehydratase, partial [Candidatus Brocadiales bacterium]